MSKPDTPDSNPPRKDTAAGTGTGTESPRQPTPDPSATGDGPAAGSPSAPDSTAAKPDRPVGEPRTRSETEDRAKDRSARGESEGDRQSDAGAAESSPEESPEPSAEPTSDPAPKATPGGRRGAVLESGFWLLLIAPLTAGLLLRYWHYAGGRSLWFGEALMAENIVTRSFADLLAPLANGQVAVFGWLALEKLLYTPLGDLELGLRLVPLVSASAALVIFAVLARVLFDRFWCLFVVSVFALLPDQVYIAAEAQPYASDVLVSVLMTTAAVLLRLVQRLSLNRLALYWLFGALGIVLSLPSLFVLLAVSVALVLARVRRADPAGAGLILLVGGLWLVQALVLYLGVFGGVAEGLQVAAEAQTGLAAFAPFPPAGLDDLLWYWQTVPEFFAGALSLAAVGLAALLFLLGALTLLRRDFFLLLLLAGPLLLALVASAARIYPFDDRLLLFAVPQCLVVVLIGLQTLMGPEARPWRTSGIAGGLAALLLLAWPLGELAYEIAKPRPFEREDMRRAFEIVSREHADQDQLYVFYAALPAFHLYREDQVPPGMTVIEGRSPRPDLRYFLADLERLRGAGKVWVLFSHVTDPARAEEMRLFQSLARTEAEELRTEIFAGGALLFYDFGQQAEGRAVRFPEPQTPYQPAQPAFRQRLSTAAAPITAPAQSAPFETEAPAALEDQPALEEAAPEEAAPEEAAPEEAAPEETTPEETSPEETSPEETSPEETIQ